MIGSEPSKLGYDKKLDMNKVMIGSEPSKLGYDKKLDHLKTNN